MPTYEFRCPAGHHFEKFFRKISDASAEMPCPECGELAQRRMSAGALLFKGSGFYITDYGKDGKGARKASEAGGDATPSEKPAVAAETKSADAKAPPAAEGGKGASPPAGESGSKATGGASSSKDSSGGSGTRGGTKGSSGPGKSGTDV